MRSSATELEGRRGVRIMPEIFDVRPTTRRAAVRPRRSGSTKASGQAGNACGKGRSERFSAHPPAGARLQRIERPRALPAATAPTRPFHQPDRQSARNQFHRRSQEEDDRSVQQRGLPYGIIVRKMDFPSTASLDEARKMLAAAAPGGSSRPVSMPLYVYRLYPDGHEELMRGVRFNGVNARSLKDILAAGDDSVTFNYLENGAPFALLGCGSERRRSPSWRPSVLIDDLELTKIEDEMPKLPIVPSPADASRTQPLTARQRLHAASRDEDSQPLRFSRDSGGFASSRRRSRLSSFSCRVSARCSNCWSARDGPACPRTLRSRVASRPHSEHSVRRAGRHSGRSGPHFGRQRNDRHALGRRLHAHRSRRPC